MHLTPLPSQGEGTDLGAGVLQGCLAEVYHQGPSNLDPAQDKNYSFRYPVQDKRPIFMTLIHFVSHTELSGINYEK